MEEKKSSMHGSPRGKSETASPPHIGGGGSGDLSGKRKRGRPRKYDLSKPIPPPPPGFSLSPRSSECSSKRGPGRPPGSRNRKLLTPFGANSTGADLTPHVMTVNTGEDVAAKIHSFSQKGPRGFCILSANGAVSTFTIRQPGSSGGFLTYEGRFEIVSLTGSYTSTENGGMRNRSGGLSAVLAGPDGRLIGGIIAGSLIAAGPVQIVIGSFMTNGYKKQNRKHDQEARVIGPVTPSAPDTVTAGKPVSQSRANGNIGLSSKPQLPLQNHEEEDNSTSTKQDAERSTDSKGSGPSSSHSQSPDINVPLPIE